MFELKNLILDFFQLVLRISLKLSLDTINKELKVAQVFSKEYFEYVLQDESFALITIFILSPIKINITAEKKSSKKAIITFYYFGSIKIIFTILIKIMIIYILAIIIEIKKSSF